MKDFIFAKPDKSLIWHELSPSTPTLIRYIDFYPDFNSVHRLLPRLGGTPKLCVISPLRLDFDSKFVVSTLESLKFYCPTLQNLKCYCPTSQNLKSDGVLEPDKSLIWHGEGPKLYS